jgi:hypothetical protein
VATAVAEDGSARASGSAVADNPRVVADLNEDGVMDIATASKHGVFIFFQTP